MLTGTATLSLSGPGSNSNEKVTTLPQNSRTGNSSLNAV